MSVEVIYKPIITVIGRQLIDYGEVSVFLESNNLGQWIEEEPGYDGERLAEFGGRVCYSAFGAKQGRKTNKEYLNNILLQQHGSVLEHAVWTFAVSGVSRSFSHELIRHRVGISPSELSQRYVDLEDVKFVLPPDIPHSTMVFDMWNEACQSALQSYNDLYDALMEEFKEDYPTMKPGDKKKHARQAARSVLPNCTETHMVLTANARTLRHIIELRGGAGAEIEIRRFANALLEIMKKESPNLFGDFWTCDGFDVIPTIQKMG